jgi:hypothetical protein
MAALDAVTWVLEPGRAPSQRADCTVLADRVGALEDPILPGGRRAKILVSSVSGPANRNDASIAVKASSEKLVERDPHLVVPINFVR